MDNKEFIEKLISWYNVNKRDLPWRKTRDSFKIWLSEIILQQTRVAQGLPYYLKFINNFNNVEQLAVADEQFVLRLWQGLGYYSRARNLHKCAREVHENFDGKFPESYEKLIKLPGIGKYTAAAIASFAYMEKVPVIDGNVYRVLSRIFGVDADIADGRGQKVFEKLAAELMPETHPDIYNQAIMEFGALQCTPKNPACTQCIFNIECFARRNNKQNELPVKSKKVKVKNRYFHYVVLKYKDHMAMRKRGDGDIWQGLYDYLMVESEAFTDYGWLLENNELLDHLHPYIQDVEVSEDYRHVLTHRRLFARFYTVSLQENAPVKTVLPQFELQLYDREAVYDLPKPVLVSRYLNDTIF
ncbi:A/G-specific adenine glycosylase [Fulvivirga imtechensis AK7]|uniref:Adenine DNA glycosylase n=1 Tax=Fulvivirga imtechensis AK7 TaxID=1237149 RepID=L8JLM2_9BACT|nr:A/G-specific adenine glycosylase [Fulvivirga imtechensis]ELR69826.1 A/G-specific adenine glycosylase [Fulvivirga imtechensis AK7]